MSNTNLPSQVSIVVIGVSNIADSLAFYRDTLGLTLKGQAGDLAFISAGPLTLMLNEGLGKMVKPIAGAIEIVFPVESVKASHALLRQRGCAFRNEPAEVTPGSWAATFRDPDGHMLTLFGPQ